MVEVFDFSGATVTISCAKNVQLFHYFYERAFEGCFYKNTII